MIRVSNLKEPLDKRKFHDIMSLTKNIGGDVGEMKKKDDIISARQQYRQIVGETAYKDTNATITTITKDCSEFDTLKICFLSDAHLGSCDADFNGLLETLKYARSQENAVIFVLGDMMNTAIVGSKSDPYEDIMSPQQQLDVFTKILKIAKDNKEIASVLQDLRNTGKIVVVHSGNHEERIRKSVGISTTKMAAEAAGVGDAYAPYYASTDLVLRQPLSKDGKFHFNVVTHHGTGIHNIDGVSRLLRNVNAHLCVIGHIHQQSMKYERLVKKDKDGKQKYQDVLCMTLPSSGGGTYGAGMSLPDTTKQAGVWLAVSSQANPHAGKISPTGVEYPDIIPAIAFFNPTNSMDTHIKQKRLRSAKKAIESVSVEGVIDKISEAVDAIAEYEDRIRQAVGNSITEQPRRKPVGYAKYLAEKENEKEGM